ncbi:uncharacterized protein LOC114179266 [Vigna unguiculata]|uniref:Uncharacterized protein n=1 Tax=Vigna unguiculata TaxID=3917 RepID=A0A4D6L752_VIGUN|nr:uncharacterized protein LOC114179266 [Vigna unguiculata]QCD84306.1 hypothetical protein DEO72_LG2g4658 [Vigna unguiculata]
MGCCVSCSHKTSTSPLRKFRGSPQPLTRREKPLESSREEESETVKQVLLEAPKRNPTTFAKPKPQKPLQNKVRDEQSKVQKKSLSLYKAEDPSDEVCSLSETVSTTTSITEQGQETRKRVDISQAKLLKNRSFPGERRERTVHGARNNVGSVRLVQCGDQTAQKTGSGGTLRRRDPAEKSFRQSRSPATGGSRPVVGRNPSVRKTNRCPARVTTSTAGNGCRRKENPATARKWVSGGESLENPLVSLECFIFI